MNTGRVYLDVPFAEKNDAKALGAWWDPARKQWYVPRHVSAAAFSRWLPEESSDENEDDQQAA
jgi:hypothetical protein